MKVLEFEHNNYEYTLSYCKESNNYTLQDNDIYEGIYFVFDTEADAMLMVEAIKKTNNWNWD